MKSSEQKEKYLIYMKFILDNESTPTALYQDATLWGLSFYRLIS